MCMGYISLAWLDSILHVRALLQAIIALHQKGVWPQEWKYMLYTASANI